MDIDPIVLMAYISVSINVITMIAACIAYAIFHIRKRRRKKVGTAAPNPADGPVTPVFLRRYPMTGAIAEAAPSELMTTALAEPRSPALTQLQ